MEEFTSSIQLLQGMDGVECFFAEGFFPQSTRHAATDGGQATVMQVPTQGRKETNCAKFACTK